MTLVSVLTLLPATRAARAAGLEKLLMPGEVSRAHAPHEENCSACHDRSDRKRQTALCLDCHKEVADDVQRRSGFHGRLPNISTSECKACHSEHLGRDADIVKLARASFDHRATDFPLEGRHAAEPCESCHAAGRPFRAAESSCGGCHRANDVHRGGLGADCARCHSSLSWQVARFEHAKTRFPLRGAHGEVACGACHVAGKFRDTPRDCVACHRPDDVHRGTRGEACGECHGETSWKNSRFDHAGETGFALAGKHAQIDCAGCHRTGKLEDPLPRDCVGCHRADDGHAARFGDACGDCHASDSWRSTSFDHTRDTGFALQGRHVQLDCHACHSASVNTQKLGRDCVSCHRGDDVHGGALQSGCESCHGVESWAQDLTFDHDIDAYPLLGMHVLVGCGQCHASRAYTDTPRDCVSCHRSGDVHQGKLGERCDSCHSPNGWKLWEFDHNRQTRFELTGRHARVACGECHRRPAGVVALPTDCASCHRENDVHLGQFGTQCQRCHGTLSFKGARIQ